MSETKGRWTCVYALDAHRHTISGSAEGLAAAIRRGADLRIYTEFFHDEHIDTSSQDHELVREVADFRITYLLNGHWTAGIISLRQPISLPDGFGPRPSMSFFLYNQDGQQAIARPYFDGNSDPRMEGASSVSLPESMPKYHELDRWDDGTNAPSSNFIYDFETFRFLVNEEWQEVLSHSANGDVASGSIEALADGFARGCEVKVGIRGLCADMSDDQERAMDHEVFVQTGSCYFYTDRRHFIAGSHPVVRVKPETPLQYTSKGWDFGWLMLRTDGLVARWLVDPYTLRFRKSQVRCSIRWFIR